MNRVVRQIEIAKRMRESWPGYLRREIRGGMMSSYVSTQENGRQGRELEKEIESLRKSIIRAYNNGYLSGHHDTVEGVFTDIHQCEMSTYHSDIVEESDWFKNKDD